MNKWLKIGAAVVVALLGVVAITAIVLAQGPTDADGTCDTCGAELGQGFGRGRRFDVDGDTQTWGWRADGEAPCDGFLDEDGDGVCDNFVDEDGDGVCDLLGTGAGTQMMRGWRFNPDGCPMGQGQGWNADGEPLCGDFVDEDGDGVCDNFVDEDGDGICDNHDQALGSGYGMRGGRMGGRMGARGGFRSNVQ